MARRSSSSSSSCAICEGSNLAAVCATCINRRLGEYSETLKSLKSTRDVLYVKLNGVLVAKKNADVQHNRKILQNEKLMKLKDKLYNLEKNLSQEKSKVKRVSNDLKVKYGLLESAFATLEKNRAEMLEKSFSNVISGYVDINSDRLHKQSIVVKQICRLFPMRKVNSSGERKDGCDGSYVQICNARLPRGLDPHSVPSEELAASLGYMLQLLNLVVPNLAAPALHNAGFAGSCSRIWQRDSYWDARPSSRSKEYPLFIPRQNFCSSGGENSWSERSSSNFGVASVDSERKSYLDPGGSSSFSYSSASSHSVETHMELQKGISLLKKSVACITAYGYNSIGLEVPSEVPTFEAFAKLLAILSSSNLKTAVSRSFKEAPRLNESVWRANSVVLSSIAESTHTAHVAQNSRYNNLSNSAASFFSTAEITTPGRSESLVDGWDIVERPTLPPPPSHLEDVEHWTRAMFTDATRK